MDRQEGVQDLADRHVRFRRPAPLRGGDVAPQVTLDRRLVAASMGGRRVVRCPGLRSAHETAVRRTAGKSDVTPPR